MANVTFIRSKPFVDSNVLIEAVDAEVRFPTKGTVMSFLVAFKMPPKGLCGLQTLSANPAETIWVVCMSPGVFDQNTRRPVQSSAHFAGEKRIG